MRRVHQGKLEQLLLLAQELLLLLQLVDLLLNCLTLLLHVVCVERRARRREAERRVQIAAATAMEHERRCPPWLRRDPGRRSVRKLRCTIAATATWIGRRYVLHHPRRRGWHRVAQQVLVRRRRIVNTLEPELLQLGVQELILRRVHVVDPPHVVRKHTGRGTPLTCVAGHEALERRHAARWARR